jgi:branched-subunit amino acid ABC-type transport system permease component
MDWITILGIEVAQGVATLVLISLGLAVIFGMMRVINFAHGEFLMLGGYACVYATKGGVPIWLSILVVAPLIVGIIGVVIERLVIRFLYGRMVDTMLATWGLSLLLTGTVTMIFGNFAVVTPTPLGSLTIGSYRTGLYSLFIIVVSVAVLLVAYAVLRWTRFGLIARATMQHPQMAECLGVAPNRVYAITFGIGAAVSGLAGAVLAPITGLVPTTGVAYIAKSFITVISGGAAILTGTTLASVIFGTINQIVTYRTTPVIGEVALLVTAIILLRVMPQGITARYFRRGL